MVYLDLTLFYGIIETKSLDFLNLENFKIDEFFNIDDKQFFNLLQLLSNKIKINKTTLTFIKGKNLVFRFEIKLFIFI